MQSGQWAKKVKEAEPQCHLGGLLDGNKFPERAHLQTVPAQLKMCAHFAAAKAKVCKGQWSRWGEHWFRRRDSWPHSGYPGPVFSHHLCPSAHLSVQAPSSLPLPGPAQPLEASRRTRLLCHPQSERRTVQTGGVENAREPRHPGCPGVPNGGGGSSHNLLWAAFKNHRQVLCIPFTAALPWGTQASTSRPTPYTQFCTYPRARSSKPPLWGRLWTQLAAPGSSHLWNALTSQFPDSGFLILSPFESRLVPTPAPTSVHLTCPSSLHSVVKTGSEIEWKPGLERAGHWGGT